MILGGEDESWLLQTPTSKYAKPRDLDNPITPRPSNVSFISNFSFRLTFKSVRVEG